MPYVYRGQATVGFRPALINNFGVTLIPATFIEPKAPGVTHKIEPGAVIDEDFADPDLVAYVRECPNTLFAKVKEAVRPLDWRDQRGSVVRESADDGTNAADELAIAGDAFKQEADQCA